MIVAALVAVTCLILLGRYAVDYFSARDASDALRAAYYDTADDAVDAPASAPAVPTASPTMAPAPEASATPTQTPAISSQNLPAVKYPDNPWYLVQDKFDKVRRQNSDIIGWLTIDGLLDEAVVQRDNAYYLRRDYRGYHNTNGALFLEEDCDLRTRPYTLMIYGHNMKTGAMFGCLRNYENLTFYQNNPLITFDSIYEDGRYVIFSVATVSLAYGDWNYLSVFDLTSDIIPSREREIARLQSQSLYSSPVDVRADDQLLLLVTCVDDEDERRIVAARRIRPDESEDAIIKKVQRVRKW